MRDRWWIIVTGLMALVLAGLSSPAQAAFPGENGRIAFVRGDDIWTMNPDGTGQVNLTNSGAKENNPAWSPDGTRIAFDSDAGSTPVPQIWTMSANGAGAVQVTSGTGPREDPAWSPDATKLTFIQRFETQEGPSVGTANTDGTGEFVGFLQTDASDPEWSPDGRRIAYADEDRIDCWYNLWTIDPDGTDADPVVDCAVPSPSNRSPTWKPNGTRLAFHTDETCVACGPDYLKTIDPNGTDPLPTTTEAYRPAWSPDGLRIAYQSSVSSDARIKTVDPDGTNIVDITDGSRPDWQPIPVNSYPRPKGATPFRASLAIAYKACTTANRTHGPPLAFPSCASPQQASDHLTVGTADANAQPALNEGSVRFDVQAGVPGGPDDADVSVQVFMDDVFTKPGLADYTGELGARVALQITDKDNTPHPGGPGAATTTSIPLTATATCAPTAATNEGSTCTATTSLDALVPGTVKEGRRAIWQLGRVELYDGGADGDVQTPVGDTLLATQGIFIP